MTVSWPLPLVQAPMAGGASGPELAAAVSDAGGLGFLAAGYKTADATAADITALRGRTDRPFGVNLFVPGETSEAVVTDELPAYRTRLAADAARYGVALGDVPAHGIDDDWNAKVALLLDDPVPVVSFTFGCPAPDLLAAFRDRGTLTAVTVTAPYEAGLAAAAGADLLVVQGTEAGAHQGRWDNTGPIGEPYGLLTLLALVRELTGLPLIATGGLMTGAQVRAVLAAGAVAAQLGTAFLRCPESGAPAAHKAALADPRFGETRLTRAFSGRPARGLVNAFVEAHSTEAPAAYPEVHYATAPIRRAAAAADDPAAMALWAGQGWRLARAEPAADVVARVTADLG